MHQADVCPGWRTQLHWEPPGIAKCDQESLHDQAGHWLMLHRACVRVCVAPKHLHRRCTRDPETATLLLTTEEPSRMQQQLLMAQSRCCLLHGGVSPRLCWCQRSVQQQHNTQTGQFGALGSSGSAQGLLHLRNTLLSPNLPSLVQQCLARPGFPKVMLTNAGCFPNL